MTKKKAKIKNVMAEKVKQAQTELKKLFNEALKFKPYSKEQQLGKKKK